MVSFILGAAETGDVVVPSPITVVLSAAVGVVVFTSGDIVVSPRGDLPGNLSR